MNEQNLAEAIKSLREAGEVREPLYLYAPTDAIAEYLSSVYPGVDVRVTPKEMMPKDTVFVLTGGEHEL